MSMEAIPRPSAGKPGPENLFPLPEVEAPQPKTPALPPGRPRLRRADRHQVELRTLAIDALLPEDHQARLVWQYVDGLDVSELSDFRTAHPEFLDELLTQSVATLMHQDLVTLHSRGSGRHACSRQRGGVFVSSPQDAGDLSGRGDRAGRIASRGG